MNEEIKEILELYKDDDVEYYNAYSRLSVDEILDYITNLQEENEKYKKIFEGKERFSKIMPDDIDFIVLSKSDYDRQEKDIDIIALEYKSRNEKAIEYIKNTPSLDGYINHNSMMHILLNILEGDDKK